MTIDDKVISVDRVVDAMSCCNGQDIGFVIRWLWVQLPVFHFYVMGKLLTPHAFVTKQYNLILAKFC